MIFFLNFLLKFHFSHTCHWYRLWPGTPSVIWVNLNSGMDDLSNYIHQKCDMCQVMELELRLSCYLVLLSSDSKTR